MSTSSPGTKGRRETLVIRQGSIAVSKGSLDRWDRWYIITQGRQGLEVVYKWYLSCQFGDYMYHRSHLSRESETAIERWSETWHCYHLCTRKTTANLQIKCPPCEGWKSIETVHYRLWPTKRSNFSLKMSQPGQGSFTSGATLNCCGKVWKIHATFPVDIQSYLMRWTVLEVYVFGVQSYRTSGGGPGCLGFARGSVIFPCLLHFGNTFQMFP